MLIVDSRCTKYMTGNLKLLTNFIEKFLGMVQFRNDQFAPILGYSRKCYTQTGNDLLIGSRGTYLYTITLHGSSSPNLICLMAKASTSQTWLWHRRLSYLNFATINLLSKKDIVNGLPKLKFIKDHLCSSCKLGKAKCRNFKSKTTSSSNVRLHLLHMDLCGPLRVESINRKKYILVIVDDYSRYTWTDFLISKDENRSKASEDNTLGPEPQSQENVPTSDMTVTTSIKESKSLFGPMFDEYFNRGYQVVSMSSVVTAADGSDKRQQQQDTISSISTTIPADINQLDIQTLEPTTQPPTVNADENINQAKNAMFDEDKFINPFNTPVHEVAESSSRNVDPSNMHTFYQRHPSDYHWTKDHPLEQVLGNPSKPVYIR
ncbi:retrovirus-related pol polyprotein from transposon TNT 1-94 [Tanacetum coccineum]